MNLIKKTLIMILLIILIISFLLLIRNNKPLTNETITSEIPINNTPINNTLIYESLIIDESLNESVNNLTSNGFNLSLVINLLSSHIKFFNTTSSLIISRLANTSYVVPCNAYLTSHYYGLEAMSLANASPNGINSAYARLNVCDESRAFTVINLLLNGSPRIRLCPDGNNSLINGRVYGNCFSNNSINAYMYNASQFTAIKMNGFSLNYLNFTKEFLNQFFN